MEAAAGCGGLVAAQAAGGDGGGSAAEVYEVFAYLVGTALGEGCVVAVVGVAVYMAGDFDVEVPTFDESGKTAQLGFGFGGETPVGGIELDAVEGLRDAVVGHLDVCGELEVV